MYYCKCIIRVIVMCTVFGTSILIVVSTCSGFQVVGPESRYKESRRKRLMEEEGGLDKSHKLAVISPSW